MAATSSTNHLKAFKAEAGPEAESGRVGLSCLKRFPSYLKLLRDLEAEGQEFVSGTVLASVHSLEPVIVRKDLAITGITGTPRIGFRVKELIAAIEQYLGWNTETKAILVGVGNLGRALMGYRGFESYRLRIVAAFDADPKKIGRLIQGIKVQSMERLTSYVQRSEIKLGVVTVSSEAAQEVVDLMVQAGILGIWHFTSVKLRVPAGVVAQKEDLAEGLAVISHRLRRLLNNRSQAQASEKPARSSGR